MKQAIKRALFQNLGWKIFSLVVAIVLWFTFVGSPELVTSMLAPVEFVNVPPDLEIISEAPDRVRLEVRGPTPKVRDYENSRPAVVLNLSGISGPGERTFTITQHQMNLAPGLELVRAVPGQVRLRFDRRATRQVPVRVVISTPPAAGYQIKYQEIRPKTVAIVGPESRIDAIHYVETDPIDLSRVVGVQEFQASVFIRDPNVRLVSPGNVSVKMTLEKQP